MWLGVGCQGGLETWEPGGGSQARDFSTQSCLSLQQDGETWGK